MVFLRYYITLFCLFIAFIVAHCQETPLAHQRYFVDISTDLAENNYYEYQANSLSQTPFEALSLKALPKDFEQLEFYDPQADAWLPLQQDSHTSHDSRSFSQLIFLTNAEQRFLVRSNGIPQGAVELHIYHPGFSGSVEREKTELRSQACPCPSPDILEREDWCLSCARGGDGITSDPGFIIIHHSAGPNESADWPAVVRAIWDFHVNVRGWDDIGYNYLIDPEGRVYKGRGDEIQGAHFCAANSGTLGICLLGTYTDQLPSAKAIQYLKYHASTDRNLAALSGHRDGCATVCPGEMLYGVLPQLAEEIAMQLDTCGSGEEGPELLVKRDHDYKVKLFWSNLSASAQTHILQIRIDENMFEERTIGKEPDSVVLYLEDGKCYDFQLISHFEGGEEERSNLVKITTPYLQFSEEKLSIYPNPANDFLHLRWVSPHNGNFQLNLINQEGRSFLRTVFSKESVLFEKNIPLSDLPSGNYILHIQTTDLRRHAMFVKVD